MPWFCYRCTDPRDAIVRSHIHVLQYDCGGYAARKAGVLPGVGRAGAHPSHGTLTLLAGTPACG